MTQLLVSVRDAEEARAALAGGADLIDVKEPRRGALGYADADALRAVAEVVGRRVPLSAALGEIADPLPPASFGALGEYQFAKLGLAGAIALADWPMRWSEIVAQLPAGVRSVAVVYADWKMCSAPPPAEILQHARALNCAALLVDTFVKRGSTSFDAMPGDELAELLARARDPGLLTVLAGSLNAGDLPQAAALSPTIVAVRGAVCHGGRMGKIDSVLVEIFRAELARNSLVDSAAKRSPVRPPISA